MYRGFRTPHTYDFTINKGVLSFDLCFHTAPNLPVSPFIFCAMYIIATILLIEEIPLNFLFMRDGFCNLPVLVHTMIIIKYLNRCFCGFL